MELALELVNHVRPEVADRLLERLRAAETARQLAEERCRRSREQPQGLRRMCGLLLDLALFLVFAILLAMEVAAALAPSQPSPPLSSSRSALQQEIPAPLFSRLPAEPHEDEFSDRNLTCEAFLFEAEQETSQLQRRYKRLQSAFGGALQAASLWVGFLQRVASNVTQGDLVECREAARPGQAAIEALLAEVMPEEQARGF